MTKFWKPLLAIALICALALAGLGLAAQSPAAAAQAKRADEFRAVWVATVYRLDYPSQATTDPAVLKRDADAILQGCVDMGMNAVILPGAALPPTPSTLRAVPVEQIPHRRTGDRPEKRI